MRQFESGATRDGNAGKPDYKGFLSPLAIRRYGEYMLRHQVQADGTLRASDNWKKGIPKGEYISSLFRHFVDVWTMDEGWPLNENLEDLLCAIIFNAQGYLHELLKGKTRGV